MAYSKCRISIVFICINIFIIFQALNINGNENKPTACTTLGRIEGQTILVQGSEVDQYLGVPFAKPPLGDLRFRKPQPLDAWYGTIRATSQPPACLQYSKQSYAFSDNEPHKSEDCLYLNIWSPSDTSPECTTPVMVWFYGGGFLHGSNRIDLYNGQVPSALGHIVLVSINYRLGSLGFMYSGTEDAPGNVGLWDVLAGLQWVHDHIRAFGGDPDRITIAGQSVGGTIAGLISCSPLARGLYCRQIVESGAATYTLADNNTETSVRSQKVAEIVGCASENYTAHDHPENVVQCMRRVPAVKIIEADSQYFEATKGALTARYGDDILPRNPRQAIIDGECRCTDLLIGNTRDEGTHELGLNYPEIFGPYCKKDSKVNKTMYKELLVKKLVAVYEMHPEEIVNYYLSPMVGEYDYYLARNQSCNLLGDYFHVCPTVYYAEKCAEQGRKVYYYLFSHRASNSPWAEWTGVVHISEVQFVFGYPLRYPAIYQPEEIELSKYVIWIWTEFIKHGSPGCYWPLYSKWNPYYRFIYSRYFDVTGEGLHRQSCDFLRRSFGFRAFEE